MKMRVGQIEIDDETGVVFHNSSFSSESAEATGRRVPSTQVGKTEQVHLLGLDFPAWDPRLYFALVVLGLLGASGVVLLAVFEGLWILLPALLPGLLLGIVLLWTLGKRSGSLQLRPPQNTELAEMRAAKIAAILSTATGPLTVESVAKTMSWTEDAVVMGLDLLAQQGRIEEDLDVETGHWTYRLSSSTTVGSETAGLSLAQRMGREATPSANPEELAQLVRR